MKHKIWLVAIAALGIFVLSHHSSMNSVQSLASAEQSTPKPQAPLNNSITLDLGSSAKATVYAGNTIISQTQYDKPGLYTIDTSSYPNGNYKIVVQTSGKTAQYVLHQTYMFSKPGQINVKISLR